MKIVWHDSTAMHGNRSCIVRIYTGESQSVRNWRTALAIQRNWDIYDSIEKWVFELSESGKDLTENDPVAEYKTFADGKSAACIFGVLSNEITPSGRVFGEYRFVLALQDEALLVLANVFKLKRRLQRRTNDAT